MNLASRTCSLDGHELHYRELGSGPPLLLLYPGPGLDGSVFFPWLAPCTRPLPRRPDRSLVDELRRRWAGVVYRPEIIRHEEWVTCR